MKRYVNVCLDLNYANGGVTKAILDFKDVLNAPVISFDCKAHSRVNDNDVHYVDNDLGKTQGRAHHLLSKEATLQAARLLDELKPDALIVHSLYRAHCHWVVLEARKRRLPWLVVPHGGLDPYVFRGFALAKRIWIRMNYKYFSEAKAVVFSTKREKLKAAVRIPECRKEVILWPMQKADHAQLRNRKLYASAHGLPLKKKWLLFLGRLDPMKQPLETIKCFRKSKPVNTVLIITGNEHPITISEARHAAGGDLNKIVFVTGPIYGEEKNGLLQSVDGFVSLSHRENFGYTTAEALLASLPVILSDGNDLVGELSSVCCGWKLQGSTEQEIEAAFADFDQSDSYKLAQMGSEGKAWAESAFLAEKFCSSFMEL